MLLIMVPDQYPSNYKALEIYTGYFDSLDNMILLSYPSSIVIMRDCCIYEPGRLIVTPSSCLTHEKFNHAINGGPVHWENHPQAEVQTGPLVSSHRTFCCPCSNSQTWLMQCTLIKYQINKHYVVDIIKCSNIYHFTWKHNKSGKGIYNVTKLCRVQFLVDVLICSELFLFYIPVVELSCCLATWRSMTSHYQKRNPLVSNFTKWDDVKNDQGRRIGPNHWWVMTDLLTLKVLNFLKFTGYCSLKPLWSGMGEVVPARTSPTLHPPSPPTVHQLLRLAL